MSNRKYGYSVILNNYMKPSDRFMAGGYAVTPDMRTTVELIDLAGKQGLAQGIELIMTDSPHGIGIGLHNHKEIKAALDANGLRMVGITPNLWADPHMQHGTLGSSDARTRRKSIDMCKQAVDIAAACDCAYVGLWPGQDGFDYHFEVNYQNLWDWWVEAVAELADHNPNVRIGLEPKPDEPRGYSLIDSAAKALLIVAAADRPNVGVCLDIGHSLYSHENIGEAVALIQRHGERLFHLHMNDNFNSADLDMIFGSVHTIEFIEMFYWLRKTGYEHFMSVDIFAYRTDPEKSVGESIRWMQAIDAFVDRVGEPALSGLIATSDPTATTAFLREHLFGQ